MFEIVLMNPEIPPNTGNIIRLCANTGTTLNLIRPLGFDLDERRLRRAGLDYHEFATVRVFDTLQAFEAHVQPPATWLFTTRTTTPYSAARFAPGAALVFGPETRGLPQSLLDERREHCITLPMRERSRSLNLSNAVAIAVYEAWRQHSFAGAR